MAVCIYYNGDEQRDGPVRCGHTKEPWAYTAVCFVQVANLFIAMAVDPMIFSV